MQRPEPCGLWKSPFSPEFLAEEKVWLRNPGFAGEDTYWLKVRAADQGRFSVVRKAPAEPAADVTPTGFSTRSAVNEYGGGRYTISGDQLYFSNFPDQRVYVQNRKGGEPRPITPEGSFRYADFSFDPRFQRLFCVCEDHSTGDAQPVQSLVSIDPQDQSLKHVASGADFYASPRINPQCTRLAWISWNHPFMPWDAAKLWVAEINENGSLGEARKIAGGAGASVFQPEWSPDGILYYVSDESGWWNLYRETGGGTEAVFPLEAEFGMAAWHLGYSTYAFETKHSIYCAFNRQGFWKLGHLETRTNAFTELDLPFTDISSVRATLGKVIFIGGSPSIPECVVLLNTPSGKVEILDRSISVEIDSGYISHPEPISFPSGNDIAHVFFYPPTNRDFCPTAGELVPLIVTAHGGPTDSARTMFNFDIQFWTSRGFALADVNYGGSTGYGRAYRDRLYGNWGIVDVQDCFHAARYLVGQKFADPGRVVIRGHSAGGFTALESLATSDLYKAGTIYFGISDLEAIVQTTHKFESHYNIRLVAPYPERRDVFVERSPFFHAERIKVPVIFFQGLLDRVVAPEQTQKMVDVIKERHVPVQQFLFEDEYHGFLNAANLERCYQEELAFYLRLLSVPSDQPRRSQ